jgi:hypothetical protein
MSNKVEVPIDATMLVLARKDAGMRKSSVFIGKDGRILPKGSIPKNKNEDIYTVIVRPSKREGPKEPSKRASKLKSCKGLRGCRFAKCAENALGKLPKNLQGLCSTGIDVEIDKKEPKW